MAGKDMPLTTIKNTQASKIQDIKNAYKQYRVRGPIKSRFIRNGCYLMRLANSFSQSHSQSWKIL